jgi:hypothetical protein
MNTKQKRMRHATNAETVEHLMNWAKSGPIVQLFVMDSLRKFATTVAALTDEEAEAKFSNLGFIHPLAWRDAAREVQQTLDEHFAGTRMVPVTDEDDDEEDDER